jgi:release factor glutamine methyltransferase
MDLERPLAQAELDRIRAYVARRRKREPVAYILGEREFFGRKFEVSSAVLIPRPDTETLVERALTVLSKDKGARMLELCTGSGAIAITLAAERPKLRVDATDISSAALAMAHQNASRHGVLERLCLYEGDLFNALSKPAYEPVHAEGDRAATGGAVDCPSPRPYDLVACNPPYIPQPQWNGLAPEITRYEPPLALIGGVDGLDYYRRICEQIAAWIVPGGTVLFEVGDGQAADVSEILQATGRFSHLLFHTDLRTVQRVVEAKFN